MSNLWRQRTSDWGLAFAGPAGLPAWEWNGRAGVVPRPYPPFSRSWPGYPLVLIRVWNPVEDAETVIRGLGLRGRSQSICPLHSDAGQAIQLVWPCDNYVFKMVNVKCWGGTNVHSWLWCSSWEDWGATLFWLELPSAAAASAFLLSLPSVLSPQGQTKHDQVKTVRLSCYEFCLALLCFEGSAPG